MTYLPDLNIPLSVEQLFEQRKFQQQVESMTEEQIKSLLLMTAEMLMLKDNIINQLIKGKGNV